MMKFNKIDVPLTNFHNNKNSSKFFDKCQDIEEDILIHHLRL